VWMLQPRRKGDDAHRDKNRSNQLHMSAMKHYRIRILSYHILYASGD
jgi:hypothetical protein